METRTPRSIRRAAFAFLVMTASLALMAAGCNPLDNDRIEIRFDSRAIGQPADAADSGDEADRLTVEVLTLNGGGLSTVAGLPNQGRAAAFPSHDGSVTGPRAIIRVSNSTNVDVLSPAARDFEFGADVRLDASSVTNGSRDDGNNVFQRGLYNDTSQYKIDVDRRNGNLTALCRIKGDAGAVQIQSSALTAGNNYRLRCKRNGNTVRLEVTPIGANGAFGATTSFENSGSIGTLSYPLAVPASIGGKLWSTSGVIAASSTDQFNGVLDNAVLTVS